MQESANTKFRRLIGFRLDQEIRKTFSFNKKEDDNFVRAR